MEWRSCEVQRSSKRKVVVVEGREEMGCGDRFTKGLFGSRVPRFGLALNQQLFVVVRALNRKVLFEVNSAGRGIQFFEFFVWEFANNTIQLESGLESAAEFYASQTNPLFEVLIRFNHYSIRMFWWFDSIQIREPNRP
jgi:hypothetical protein